MRPRAAVYVDGFNLYYGMVRGGPYKWLDLECYFRMLRDADDIQRICYFTATISGPTKRNQQTYLRALRTLPSVDIVLGKFMPKTVRCRVRQCTFRGSRSFKTHEEKGTDVSIAIRMMEDVHNDRCDNLILVTGDADLVPAIRMVRTLAPGKKVIVYTPARKEFRDYRYSGALEKAAHRYRWLPEALLKHAQFPQRVPDASGGFIEKPVDW